MNTNERNELLSALGFRLETGQPSGQVDNDNWPHIAYTVTLFFNGKRVLSTDYRLGIGHVDIKKARPDSFVFTHAARLTPDEESMLRTWQSNPHASLKNKELQAQVAGKLARYQKVSPQLDDVVHSLLSDGQAFFNAQSFEDWADDCGYDKDSRKAESIYRACDEIGRKLAAGIPKEIRDKASEILQDM